MNLKNKKITISTFDKKAYKIIRENINNFLKRMAKKYDKNDALLLDIAPQIHEGAKAYFKKVKIKTLDIEPSSNATYIADITKFNPKIENEKFDIIICTEVLEHTFDPYGAIKEISRILKPSGILLASVPFNFRIHGPFPDCWRFTIHGLEILFKEFKKVKIYSLDTPNRDLMPLHYTIEAIK